MTTRFVQEELIQRNADGLLRRLRTLDSPCGRQVVVDGKRALNFSSNDYLGLSNDPRIIAAAKAAMDVYGLGAGASRLVSGNHRCYEELENALASLKHTASALVFNSGYAANTGIISSLVGREDAVLCDRLNHASIIDGIILSRAKLKRYAHADMEHLEDMLKQSMQHRRRLIVTDSVFSMDGDCAPLTAMVHLAKQYDAMLMVDEAHGFGVMGAHGGGLAQELGVQEDMDIQMGTLSKAAGCFGAYVCLSKDMRSFLVNHARSLIYTTALPPSIVAAAAKAVELIADPSVGGTLRRQLKSNADYLREQLRVLGFNTLKSESAIIPVIGKTQEDVIAMSSKLFDKGFLVQAIRPPTVPVHTSRLRVAVMATHTRADLDDLVAAMRGL